MVGATYVARWRSGLTHMPFTHAFMGSNPVRVTIVRIEVCLGAVWQIFSFFA